jgi:hypothetical protein
MGTEHISEVSAFDDKEGAVGGRGAKDGSKEEHRLESESDEEPWMESKDSFVSKLEAERRLAILRRETER